MERKETMKRITPKDRLKTLCMEATEAELISYHDYVTMARELRFPPKEQPKRTRKPKAQADA